MGTSIRLQFYKKEKDSNRYEKVEDFYEDAMKAFFNEDVPEVFPEIEDVGVSWEHEFWGMLPKDTQLPADVFEDVGGCITFVKGVDTTPYNNMKLEGKAFNEIKRIDKEELHIYFWRKYQYRTKIYNSDGLATYRDKVERLAMEHYERVIKIRNLKEQISYYTLSEEEKQALEDDLEYHNDMREEYLNQAYACHALIIMLDVFKDKHCNWDDELVVAAYAEY